MRTQHLPSSDASGHIPSFTDSFHEKDLQNPGDIDTPSPPPPIESDVVIPSLGPQSKGHSPGCYFYCLHPLAGKEENEAAEKTKADVEATLDLPETGLQNLILTPDTQDHKNAGTKGYESDLKSFATASFFAPVKTEQEDGGNEVQPDRRGSHPRDRRIRFQDVHVDGDELGVLASGAYKRLYDDEIDRSRGGTTVAHSNGLRVQEKADFSSGQDVLSGRDGSDIGRGREEPMEGYYISGSDSMMMVGVMADDAPPYHLGVLGWDSINEKGETMDADESMDVTDIGARTPQAQGGGSSRAKKIRRSFPEPAIEVPNPFLVPTRATSSTSTLTNNRQSHRNSNVMRARATIDPLTPQSEPLSLTPAIHPISCECGRIIDFPPSLVTPAAAAHFQDPRQRQFNCDEPTSPSQTPTRPLSMASSYFVPLSSFLPSSYQVSFTSWRDSIIAPSCMSLLSSHIHIGNDGDDEESEEVVSIRHGPAAGEEATLNHLPKDKRFLGFGHHSNHGHAGIHGVTTTAKRLAGLVMSTGQATLGYVKDTVASQAIHLAHRSASSTIGFLTSHIPVSSTLPSMLPRFIGDVITGRQGANNDHGDGTKPPGGGGTPEGRRSRLTVDGRGLSDRMSRSAPELANTRTGEPSLPEAVYHRTRRSTDPSICKTKTSTTTPTTTSTAMTTTNRPRRARRTTLQTIPGPEGLDPETRRRLEAQGFAALGLRDESAGQGWRNWWDPRRYGLPKYIICHQIRTPRPCTTILFLIVIVCIVLPIVFHHK
ncbi:hypothetical protein EC957_006819 [Mortierella hygrophila]|uniref:Uncharacterized protein n=1 Tax=Mortierella hygrophila TaxID=979708 RepID=A0A9P6K6A8_9FUNG|nr:hypothetical protein EC957_006819 [Mortierella hygrophila]